MLGNSKNKIWRKRRFSEYRRPEYSKNNPHKCSEYRRLEFSKNKPHK